MNKSQLLLASSLLALVAVGPAHAAIPGCPADASAAMTDTISLKQTCVKQLADRLLTDPRTQGQYHEFEIVKWRAPRVDKASGTTIPGAWTGKMFISGARMPLSSSERAAGQSVNTEPKN